MKKSLIIENPPAFISIIQNNRCRVLICILRTLLEWGRYRDLRNMPRIKEVTTAVKLFVRFHDIKNKTHDYPIEFNKIFVNSYQQSFAWHPEKNTKEFLVVVVNGTHFITRKHVHRPEAC